MSVMHFGVIQSFLYAYVSVNQLMVWFTHLNELSILTLNKAVLYYPQLLRITCSSISPLNEVEGNCGPVAFLGNIHTDSKKTQNILLSQLIIRELVKTSKTNEYCVLGLIHTLSRDKVQGITKMLCLPMTLLCVNSAKKKD